MAHRTVLFMVAVAAAVLVHCADAGDAGETCAAVTEQTCLDMAIRQYGRTKAYNVPGYGYGCAPVGNHQGRAELVSLPLPSSGPWAARAPTSITNPPGEIFSYLSALHCLKVRPIFRCWSPFTVLGRRVSPVGVSIMELSEREQVEMQARGKVNHLYSFFITISYKSLD